MHSIYDKVSALAQFPLKKLSPNLFIQHERRRIIFRTKTPLAKNVQLRHVKLMKYAKKQQQQRKLTYGQFALGAGLIGEWPESVGSLALKQVERLVLRTARVHHFEGAVIDLLHWLRHVGQREFH